MSYFGPICTAMITPFAKDLEIDYQKVTKLVEYLIENGSDSILVAGTTGESPTLTTEEKLNLFEHVVRVVNKRVPVIAGTGSNDTASSIELTKKATSLGVDAIMLVVPYYNKPTQKGLIAHFKTIAKSTNLPIMLYNIPGRTSINMTVETVVELSKVSNIVAIKEASGDLNQMGKTIAQTDDTFELYSGDDALALPVMAIGGVGVVSVASHLVGKELKKMLQLYSNGNIIEAASIHRKLLNKFESLFIFSNPVPLKALLKEEGIDMGSVRLPLVELNNEEHQLVVQRFLKK